MYTNSTHATSSPGVSPKECKTVIDFVMSKLMPCPLVITATLIIGCSTRVYQSNLVLTALY